MKVSNNPSKMIKTLEQLNGKSIAYVCPDSEEIYGILEQDLDSQDFYMRVEDGRPIPTETGGQFKIIVKGNQPCKINPGQTKIQGTYFPICSAARNAYHPEYNFRQAEELTGFLDNI